MSGLLHISQISFDRIEDLPSIMQLGMKLKCMIIDHDKVRLNAAQPAVIDTALMLYSWVFDEPATYVLLNMANCPKFACPQKTREIDCLHLPRDAGERTYRTQHQDPGAGARRHDQEPPESVRHGRGETETASTFCTPCYGETPKALYCLHAPKEACGHGWTTGSFLKGHAEVVHLE